MRRLVALTLLALSLGGIGCKDSRCHDAAVQICEACQRRWLAATGEDAAAVGASPAGAAPTPAAMDLQACIERTRAACEAHQGPPNCPY